MKYEHKFIFLAVIVTLSACTVGKNYTPPLAKVPKSWSHQSKIYPQHTLRNSHWWKGFHDPILTRLVEQESVKSLDLKTAQARLDIAKADYSIAFAQFFPKAGINLLPPDGTGTGLTQLLALSTSLELDLFGKQRETRKAAKANLEEAAALQAFALINLRAEIVNTYLEYRESQEKKSILTHNLKKNSEVAELLQSRYRSGISTLLDLTQQEALIAAQAAEIEQNNALLMALRHKLELLTGNPPGFLTLILEKSTPLPVNSRKVNLGIPAGLLCQRPDIIAAERRVASAHANIKAALASLFPQVSVGWLLAWQTNSLANNILSLQHSNSTFLGTFGAPLVNVPLIQMVSLREREKLLAVLQYEITVMQALHEVSTQYQYWKHYQKSLFYIKKAVERKRLALKLAKNIYLKGSSDFNVIYQAEEEINKLELVSLHTQVMSQIAKVNLYKALGF